MMSDLDVKGLREWLEQLEYYEGKLTGQVTVDSRQHFERARRACLLLIKSIVGRELRREENQGLAGGHDLVPEVGKRGPAEISVGVQESA